MRRHAFGDRRLAALEAHEDHADVDLELDRHEAVLAAIELREGIGRADAAVAAVEVVGPAVVHAGQEPGAAAALALHDRMRAVAADVVEGAQRAVGPAHDEAPAAEE